MASKGQKFRSYSAKLKQTILIEYFDGIETPRTLSLKYDVPFKTIKNRIAKCWRWKRQENGIGSENGFTALESIPVFILDGKPIKAIILEFHEEEISIDLNW